MSNKPTLLVILDGWGVAPASEANAISQARIPNFTKYVHEYPVMALKAAGEDVGMKKGDIGNSTVGHLNLGAGRICYQPLERIDESIKDGSFFDNKTFLQAIEHVKKHRSTLHLLGLLSNNKTHACKEHCYALLELAKQKKVKNVCLHVVIDSKKDKDGVLSAMEELVDKMKILGLGRIVTISSRYYAMDRDNCWNRINKMYQAMVERKAETSFVNPLEAVKEAVKNSESSEELVPSILINEDSGKSVNRVKPKDALIFFNFNPDRSRELTRAFVLPAFTKFSRPYIKDLFFVTMTEYEKEIPALAAFPQQVVQNCLAEVISSAGLSQLHVAETEKYASLTFFFNGRIEDPFPGEERVMIHSPSVSSFEQVPRMSSAQLTKEIIQAIESKKYDFIVANYGNLDLVGHTGNFNATVTACEEVDVALGKIVGHTLAKHGSVVVTSSHGKAENMFDLHRSQPIKSNTDNPVPLLIINEQYKGQAGVGGDPLDGDLSLLNPVGRLADVAPTVLKVIGLDLPLEMTGKALI